jgi:hypothetical protein
MISKGVLHDFKLSLAVVELAPVHAIVPMRLGHPGDERSMLHEAVDIHGGRRFALRAQWRIWG